ncbi:MAG: hypothetical protein U0136_00020 [Bdellovibrionota bacterium]
MKDDSLFEAVHTVFDWYDGPRCGIANYKGSPHLFQSELADAVDPNTDTFLLAPLDADTFALALEDRAIWRRWETAYWQGRATQDTHSALPDDRPRHAKLQELLNGRLRVEVNDAVRASAEFRICDDPSWAGFGWRPLEVRWSELAGG